MNKRIKRNIIIAAVVFSVIIEIITFAQLSFSVDFKQAKKYYQQGEYSKSVSLYLNLIERDTNGNSELYILCADSYIASGDYESALNILNNAIDNGADKNYITEKMNQIQAIETSTPLELTQDYQIFIDKAIIPFFIILTLTLSVVPILNIYNRKKQKEKVLYSREMALDTYEETNKKHICVEVEDSQYGSLLNNAISIVINNGLASTSLLQRKLSLGYARAATLIDTMEHIGIVGPYNGSNPRKVLVGKDFFDNFVVETKLVEKSEDQANITPLLQENEFKTENNKCLTIEDILNKVDKMSENGWEFEKFTANLLLKNGFSSAEVTSSSNDYGVDVIAVDSLGVKYAIQCKCYSNKLNNKPVQEVVSGMAMYNCHVGVVFTNNFFTDNAIKVAQGNNVFLWDRCKLIELVNNAIKEKSALSDEIFSTAK